MSIYRLRVKAEMLRIRMHSLATKHSLTDARVLRVSRLLDSVVVEIMRRERGANA